MQRQEEKGQVKILHVGCGGSPLPDLWKGWEEIRFDADPQCGADLIGDMLDIPMDDDSVDAVYTSHTLEHVTYHDGVRALREFRRVLKPGGQVWVIVPNVLAAAELIAKEGLYAKVYDAPCGPVHAADMLWGHQGLIEGEKGERAYRFAHRFGYTADTLTASLKLAGFNNVKSDAFHYWDVAATGTK